MHEAKPLPLRVVLTDCPSKETDIERRILQEIHAELIPANWQTANELAAVAEDADALLVCWAKIPKDLINRLRRCKLISLYTAGFDNVDLEAARAAGIAVCHNPGYCTKEVATHALALILACNRKLFPLREAVDAGLWNPASSLQPAPLYEQTLGILGFGRIGCQLAHWISPMVARVIACKLNSAVASDSVPNVEFVPLDVLLRESDYLSVHLPLNDNTRGLLGRKALAQMKPTAYVINTSRGAIIDEQALGDALRAGKLAGAALDVFASEPLPQDHSLRGASNVIITPHVAWFSNRSEYLLHANAARAIVRFFNGLPVKLLNEVVPEKKPR